MEGGLTPKRGREGLNLNLVIMITPQAHVSQFYPSMTYIITIQKHLEGEGSLQMYTSAVICSYLAESPQTYFHAIYKPERQ